MKQSHDFKLNESLFHSSFKERHLTVHRVRNSILRNVITESSDRETIERENDNYEKHLKLKPLYKNELTTYLRWICNNPEMTVPSKNLIKRVMIEFFDDEIMSNITGDSFFTSIELLQWKKGTEKQLDKDTKHFYLILKGKMIFQNRAGETRIKEGEYYGHQEILWGQTIKQVKVITDSVVFSVREQFFNMCLKQSFNNKFKANLAKLGKHPCFQNYKHFFEIKRLFLHFKHRQFLSDQVICDQGDQIQQVLFLTKGKLKTQNQHFHKIKGLGLKELCNCESVFSETVLAQTDCQALTLPASIFRKVHYIKWLRDTLPEEPKRVVINVDQIGKDKKSTFKVRKTSMSLKKSIKNNQKLERGAIQCISFENNFLFLNQKPMRRRRGSPVSFL